MKIEGNRPNVDAGTLQRLEKAVADGRKADTAQAAKPAAGDRVELSQDAALASDAVKRANDSPDIRQELVDRMRALKDAGTLGNDAGKLADSLIDHMTEKK